jgi:membrane-bound lytic murein transglycosylase D
MKAKYFYILLFIVMLVSGCATSGGQGGWIKDDNPPVRSSVESPVNALNSVDNEDVGQTPYAVQGDDTAAGNGHDASFDNDLNGQNLLDTALDFCEASKEFWAEGKPEQAIDALDEAYGLIMQVDIVEHPELIQQKEDLRGTISKRILEIYASRFTVANGNHKAIPLIMNKFVEKEIKGFQGHERKFFIESYRRSGYYRKEIVKALNEAGLPEELSWLPLIESGFKVNAYSKARALGLWQFIPSTGYKFGMKRDTWIDERLDPEKATAAAIAYLTELHNIFGDWSTVLAGYNCGEGRVLRVIRRQKINYLDNFWDLYQMLPRETARYVPRFIAVLHILKDPEKYGIKLPEPYAPLSFDTVTVKKQVELKAVAKRLGVTYKELKALNPELRLQITPPSSYPLNVPEGRGDTLSAQMDKIPRWSAPERAYAFHKVRKGETLSIIALKYRSSVSAITRANNIRKKHLIRIGQKLKIPLKKGSRVYVSRSELLPGGKYKIKKGDSLWRIAEKFNTSISTLQKKNGMKSTQLYVGQILKVE